MNWTRLLQKILRCYPPSWQARYGDEMRALVDDLLDGRGRARWTLAAGLAFGALKEHVHPTVNARGGLGAANVQQRLAVMGLVALPVGFAALGFVCDTVLVHDGAVVGFLIGCWYAIVLTRASFGSGHSTWEPWIVVVVGFVVLAWVLTFGGAGASPSAPSYFGQFVLVLGGALVMRVGFGAFLGRQQARELEPHVRSLLTGAWAAALIATAVLFASIYTSHRVAAQQSVAVCHAPVSRLVAGSGPGS